MAVVVPIVADTSGLSRGLKGAGGSLSKFGRLAAVAIGVGVTAELYKSVKAAAEAEKSTQALRGQLQSLGKSDDVNKLQEQFTQLATTMGVDDEAASRAFTTILRLTGDSTKAMEGLNLALDLSANTGFADLEKNAMQVGRAINGNTRLFKQFGITVDENTTKQEALAIVQRRVQGQAESFGASATGSFQRFNEAVENLRESIGAPLVIALANAASKVSGFLNQLRERPTLTAKVSFVIGSFQKIAWASVRSITTWWNTAKVSFEDNPANRLKVNISPAGRDQVNAFAADLKVKLDKAVSTAGTAIGRNLGRAIFGGASKEAATLSNPFGNEFIRNLFVSMPALQLGRDIAMKIFDGIAQVFSERGANNPIVTFLQAIGFAVSPALATALREVRKSKPQFVKAFDVIITDPIKDAISTARESLSGLGSTLGGLLSTITGRTSTEAIAAAEIRKQQKIEAAAREERMLRDALATATTDDDRRKAQQDLDDFLLDQEAQRLEGVVAERQAADQLSIDNLIEEFNRGLIGADTFSARLEGIIGKNRGEELGTAFAGGFSRALTSLTTEVAGIVAGVAGVQAPAGSTVAAGQSQAQEEKNAAYEAALAEWKQRRADRLRAAEEARRRPGSRAGERIDPGERAEIHRIMAAWDADPRNKKPVRMAMGGILKKQVFTAGEAGAEAVIPLNSTSAMNMLRDAVGGGQPGHTQVINLTVNAGLGTDPDELGRVIVESIKRFEKRNGQAFSAPLLSVTQNIAGQTATGSTKTDFNRVTTLRKG